MPWYSLFASIFMHGGWLHIIGNMWFLWIFGDNVEDRLGHFKFLLFYLLCGIGASLIHVVFNAGSRLPTVGASGAISGVLGAYLISYPHARVTTLLIIIIFIRIVELPRFPVFDLLVRFSVCERHCRIGSSPRHRRSGILGPHGRICRGDRVAVALSQEARLSNSHLVGPPSPSLRRRFASRS